MIILGTRKWRRRLAGYLIENDLPHAGKAKGEEGWTVETGKPFGNPGRHVIKRVSNHLEARGVITAKQNDGTLNNHVQRALNPPLTMADKAVAYAVSQVGVHETPWGENRGKDVHRYQSSTGAYNAPWCASFYWYCWQQAGYKGPTSAGAWDTTDNHGTRIALAHAKPGDAVSLDGGQGHVGMLLKHNVSAKTATLCAGNTGDSVKQKDYPVSSIHSICRPHN